MTDPGGSALSVNSILYDNDGFGLANNLRWKADGVKDNETYHVHITNVIVNSIPESYEYDFTLITN
jgi:hypothetical protein